MTRRIPRRALLALLAAAAAFLVFAPSLSSGWLNWDDWILVTQNPHIRGLGWDQLRWDFTAALGGAYQPLAYLSYALDFAAWGPQARGYHLTNALLHALCAALVFLAARRILALSGPCAAGEPEESLDAAALFAALVFAVHPLRVESVSWIAERRDALSGALWLGGVLAYLRARTPDDERRSLSPVYCFFAAACFAKGIAVTLPLVLLVLDLVALAPPVFRGRDRKDSDAHFGRPVSGVAARSRWAAAGRAAPPGKLDRSRPGRAAGADGLRVLVFEVRKTVWPASLSPFYELAGAARSVRSSFFSSRRRARRLRRGRVALAARAARTGRRGRGVCGHAASRERNHSSPAPNSSRTATRTWPAFLGRFSRGELCERACAGRAAAASAAAAAAVVALAAACVAQQSYWRDSEGLWRRVLALDSASPTGWVNLGAVLAGQRRTPEAADAFARALAADPACPPLVERLSVPVARGETDGAEIRSVRAALETRPVCRKALANFGTACAELESAPKPGAICFWPWPPSPPTVWLGSISSVWKGKPRRVPDRGPLSLGRSP